MFITRLEYDELIAQRTRATVLSEQAAQGRTQMAFLMARVNQLEQERAVYLRQLTKLEIPIPQLVPVPTPAATMQDADILAALGSSMFEDMGETEARRQGLGWDETGAVISTARTGSDHA